MPFVTDHRQLIILDDELPDGRGGDFARELRQHPGTADLALVVCTGAHPGRRAEIRGWAPVISKPFDLTAVERHLAAAHPGGHLVRRDARDPAELTAR